MSESTALARLLDSAKNAPAMFSLAGKSALVVGGNKGIGQAMALAMAAAGADVAVAGRGPAGLADTADAVTSLGRKGRSYAADATNEEAVEKLVADVVRDAGGVDILVNSQGLSHLQPAAEFDMTAWEKVMNVNLKSLVLCCKHVGKHMLTRGGGKIINVSSVRAFQGRAADLAYAPSKGAVNQLTRSLAIEWGSKGINVNAIAPCFIRTEMTETLLSDPKTRDWVLSRIPMKRTGELPDMFGPVIFLASDASRFINGHVIPADGGWLSA